MIFTSLPTTSRFLHLVSGILVGAGLAIIVLNLLGKLKK
jgi:hypothetical protein